MFPGTAFLEPGQELREFSVSRPVRGETSYGLPRAGQLLPLGTVTAVLAQARPQEKEQWKQLQHPITHKIIQQYAPAFEIKAGDVFEYNGRKFFVQTAPYNVGGLGHWTIYYCEERSDV